MEKVIFDFEKKKLPFNLYIFYMFHEWERVSVLIINNIKLARVGQKKLYVLVFKFKIGNEK